MDDPLQWIEQALQDLTKSGRQRRLSQRLGPQQADGLQCDGMQFGDRPLINFGSNDYLGFASEALLPAVRASLDRYGWGAGASPLLGGRSEEHALLEKETAEFEGCSACLVFPTGFAANVGCITSLVGKSDVIFSDAGNHASIIDGCRLSRAQVQIYRHNDMDHLASLLQQCSGARRRLIVSDTLFSMGGDVAPLAVLADLSRRHDAMLMLDEAHATGVFGAGGRGLCEQAGIEHVVSVRVGTFSKALGSQGGFVVGSEKLIQWLANRARPYFFSTASPAAVAAASREALRLVQREPERRRELSATAQNLREALNDAGWSTGQSQSQIVPIMIGSDEKAMQISQRLADGGIFAPGIRPPTVPDGEALIRVSLNYGHSPEHIQQLLDILGRPGD